MRVIGAGYGRTGTKSLKLALEQIGCGKCYHMEELLRNPDDINHWLQAEKNANPNWKTLFTEYRSAVDFPVAIYYKELADAFPDAKVILTLRDAESWYESVKHTIYTFDPGMGAKVKLLAKMPFSSNSRNFLKVIQHNNRVIWQTLFEGKFENKDHAINLYLDHIEEVKQTIPANRLLLFDVRDGWDPLCRFLQKEQPEAPFPNTNKSQKFHTWAKQIVQETI